MINLRALKREGQYKEIHQKNLEKSKRALNFPSTSPVINQNTINKEKESLRTAKSFNMTYSVLKIDKYVFSMNENIKSLDYSYELALKKIATLKDNIYFNSGSNILKLDFKTQILKEKISYYEGFFELVEKNKPLDFSTLESIEKKKILITSLNKSISYFVLDADKKPTYQSLELDISGVIF